MPSEADGSAPEEIVTFRLPPRDRAAIQRLVDAGAFQNRSDFLRHAIRMSLRELDAGVSAPKLDLDLEAIELPDQPAASRARSRAQRARRGPL